jgi:hypothetical protein
MEIQLTKRDGRNQLTCVRADGSRTSANLGPGLPYHDLAHYVVERSFKLRQGFYGNIAAGYSIDALSDKNVIKTLASESWTAEILARALGSLLSGACTSQQFSSLVNEELAHLGLPRVESITAERISEMRVEYQQLVARYDSLVSGGAMSLVFD